VPLHFCVAVLAIQNGRLRVVPAPSTGQSAGLTGRIGTTSSNTASISDGDSGPSGSTVSSTVNSTVSSTAVPVTGMVMICTLATG
jgi:hypothetical protein